MANTPRTPSEQSDEQFDRQKEAVSQDEKATRFDGNPDPKGAQSDALKPKDDTPMNLEKREDIQTGRTQTNRSTDEPFGTPDNRGSNGMSDS